MRTHPSIPTLFVCLCVSATGDARAGEGYEQRFEFMSFYCLECHDATIQEGDVRLDNVSYQTIRRNQVPFWRMVFESMENHSMPPEDELQPEPDEFQSIMRWMRRGLTHPRPPRPERPTLRMGAAYEHAIRRAFDLDLRLPQTSLIGHGKSLGAKGKPTPMSAEIRRAYIA
ncbi:MAG: c-type cytochrome domain-containing protein, partial [Planctomycetota bacterium]